MSFEMLSNWVFLDVSPIHGMGVFARAAVPAGTRVLEYFGETISKEESRKRCERGNQYIFAIDDERDLDGEVGQNLARFVNHSCAPNCEAILSDGHIWIVAVCDIPVTEEITINYGYDLEEYRQHTCQCGAEECVGYMVAEELFGHVRAQSQL